MNNLERSLLGGGSKTIPAIRNRTRFSTLRLTGTFLSFETRLRLVWSEYRPGLGRLAHNTCKGSQSFIYHCPCQNLGAKTYHPSCIPASSIDWLRIVNFRVTNCRAWTSSLWSPFSVTYDNIYLGRKVLGILLILHTLGEVSVEGSLNWTRVFVYLHV